MPTLAKALCGRITGINLIPTGVQYFLFGLPEIMTKIDVQGAGRGGGHPALPQLPITLLVLNIVGTNFCAP